MCQVKPTLMECRKQGAIDQIAKTALELFARNGFEATSVETIASAAGCSPRTFYRYFGTKEDVMFHDLPAVLEDLGRGLERHLADGLRPWAAVTESFVDYIRPFDVSDPELPTRRLQLWLNEPALRTRFAHYISQAETVIAERLHDHRGTTPQVDELPELIAVAATGAYRVTLLNDSATPRDPQLAAHLRAALAAIGAGLAETSAPPQPELTLVRAHRLAGDSPAD